MNEQKLDNLLLELGHDDFNRGTQQLRIAVRLYDGQPLTKELYPAIAKAAGTSAARVERNIRHSIGKAWQRCPIEVQYRMFGNTVNPNTGRPTVGEYVARLAKLCHED